MTMYPLEGDDYAEFFYGNDAPLIFDCACGTFEEGELKEDPVDGDKCPECGESYFINEKHQKREKYEYQND